MMMALDQQQQGQTKSSTHLALPANCDRARARRRARARVGAASGQTCCCVDCAEFQFAPNLNVGPRQRRRAALEWAQFEPGTIDLCAKMKPDAGARRTRSIRATIDRSIARDLRRWSVQ